MMDWGRGEAIISEILYTCICISSRWMEGWTDDRQTDGTENNKTNVVKGIWMKGKG